MSNLNRNIIIVPYANDVDMCTGVNIKSEDSFNIYMKNCIRNAGPYIFRFWTGSFRLISTSYKYNPITIIHTPDEKNHGILKIYNYLVKHNNLPSNEKIYKILYLKYKKPKTIAREILNKFTRR